MRIVIATAQVVKAFVYVGSIQYRKLIKLFLIRLPCIMPVWVKHGVPVCLRLQDIYRYATSYSLLPGTLQQGTNTE